MNNRLLAAELGGGYRRTPGDLASFQILGDFVAVEEQLDVQLTDLILIRKSNATLGTVLLAGDRAQQQDNLHPGDRVVYEEWQGGRWAFPDADADGGERRCLIMRAEHIICRVVEE